MTKKRTIPPIDVFGYSGKASTRPTSPGPPRKRVFPAVTLIGIEALAVGQVVDQLEDTIRVLLGRLGGMPHTAVTRKDIETAISEAERICEQDLT